MARPLLFMALCVLGVPGCASYRDRAALSNGTWNAERMEMCSKSILDTPLSMTFALESNSVIITVGATVHKGICDLRADNSPKEIDIRPDATNLSDRTLYGIYALDADGRGLMMCVSETKRPRKFATSAGSDQVLIYLKKQ